MSEIKHIRKRISSRRSRPRSPRSENQHSFFFTAVYSVTIIAMVSACFGLGWMINGKLHLFDTAGAEKVWRGLTDKLDLQSLSGWIPFESWFAENKNEPVAANVSYQLISDHYYTSSAGNQVPSLMNGVVLYIGSQDSGQLVMVKHDNGVLATYGALEDVQVKLNDRIMKGVVLGTARDAVYLDFTAQGQPLSLEQALSYEN